MPDSGDASRQPWAAGADVKRAQPPKKHPWRRWLPVVGPLLLFVAVGHRGARRLHQADPAADADRHADAPWSPGSPAGRSSVTSRSRSSARCRRSRSPRSIGVPLGVLLGSNERAYRSVEFLIDFFRSTPSSALIPLFLLIFGVSDINKVAIAASAPLIVRVQQRLRRDQRAQAAHDGGEGHGRHALADLQDVLMWESAAADVRRPAQRGVDGAGDRDRGRDVHRLRQRPRPPHHRCAAGVQREEHVRGHPGRGRARAMRSTCCSCSSERRIVHWSGR